MMKRYGFFVLSILVGGLVFLAGCDKGGDAKDGKTSLVNVTEEAAGANCASGGKKIETGIDANNDGVLQAEEVSATSYACGDSSGGAVMVKEADGTDIGYLTSNETFSDWIIVMTTKGYLLQLNIYTGGIYKVSGVDGCYYKKGGTVVTDCQTFYVSYHNTSDCSDADIIEDGVAYSAYMKKNTVWNYQNALYTTDLASELKPAFYYKGYSGSCYANSTFLYKIKATTTESTGVKLTYKVPLRYFVGSTELQ